MGRTQGCAGTSSLANTPETLNGGRPRVVSRSDRPRARTLAYETLPGRPVCFFTLAFAVRLPAQTPDPARKPAALPPQEARAAEKSPSLAEVLADYGKLIGKQDPHGNTVNGRRIGVDRPGRDRSAA